jgi:biopolymer transport protein ExbD
VKLERTRRTDFAPLIFFPLATVSLLLLVFFLLSSHFVLQPGISLSLPGTSFALPPQPDALFVTVAAGNPPRVFLQDAQTTIEGLPALLARHTAQRPPVIIRADRSASYHVVVAVADAALTQGFPVALAAESKTQ